MTLPEAVNLIKGMSILPGVPATWADFGCGSGLFTQALATMLPAGSMIYAVDKELQIINQPANGVQIDFIQADFEENAPSLPPLDGVLMANALHYVQAKKKFLTMMQSLLHHDSCWLIVEYDTQQANAWIPYPVDFDQLTTLFRGEGYKTVRRLAGHPSRFRQEQIYSAIIS